MPVVSQACIARAAPSLSGVGAALPVILCAFLIVFANECVGRALNLITQIEWWMRNVIGVVLPTLAGVHHCHSITPQDKAAVADAFQYALVRSRCPCAP